MSTQAEGFGDFKFCGYMAEHPAEFKGQAPQAQQDDTYDSATDLFISMNDEGLILFASKAAFNMLGYQAEELVGKSFDSVFFDCRTNSCTGSIRRLLKQSGQVLSRQGMEYTGFHKDGRELAVDLTLTASGWPARQWMAVVHDSTARNNDRRKIAHSEAFLRAMAENSPLAFYVVDHASDKILYFNHLFCSVWNLDHLEKAMRQGELPASVVTAGCAAMLKDQSFADNWPSLRVPSNREVVEDEVYLRDDRVLRRFSSQIRDASDAYLGRMFIFEDVTERRRANNELKKAKQDAELALRVKSDFLACMSHEIRTPMNGVLGMVQLLMSTKLDAEQSEYTDAIYESAEALLTVINDILDFSKLEAGRLDIELVKFNLFEHVQQTAAVVEPIIRKKGLEFKVEVAEAVPDTVITDPARLRQILLNLLGNATKFTHEGTITLRAECVSRGAEESILRFTVQDTGIGIAPEHQELIFEKFTQADSSTTRKYGGTGLGLSICKQLTTLMGGTVSLQSSVGSGSSFWADIPVGLADRPSLIGNNSYSPEAVAKKQDTDLSGFHILVAEDNPVNQRVAQKMLQKLGCIADIASDGAEAVQMAVGQSYDFILMDCEMPVMNGFEATAEIHKRLGLDAAPPIIALTAHAMAGYGQQCMAAGMSGYLTKPLEFKDFLQTVAGFAAGKAQAELQTATVVEPTVNELKKALLQKFEGDAELVVEIVNLFVADWPNLLAKIQDEAHQQNGEAVARTAHTLKGCISHFSQEEPFHTARNVEHLCRQKDFPAVTVELGILEKQLKDLSANLQGVAMEVVP